MNTSNDLIRIAFVITELEVGGAERCLVNVATQLDRSRFLPCVFCLAPPPAQSELVDRLRSTSVDVHFLGARSAWQFLSARATLRRLLAELRPDVVQSFLFHANVVAASALTAGDGSALVLGMRVADPSKLRAIVERRAAQRAERVVCVSESVAQFAHGHTGIPAEKTLVIPNGIDLSNVAATAPADLRESGISPAARRLLVCIGRLHHQKGVDLLLQQMPAIFEALPEHDLLIVGEGPMLASLENQVADYELEPRVHFLGRRADIPQVLARCEILLLHSRWEGMPNVVLEAMAAGRPVVVSETEGVAELLGPLAEPQMVRRDRGSEFAERVIYLASHTSEATDLGRQNRQRVAASFEMKQMVKRYEDLFAMLADR